MVRGFGAAHAPSPDVRYGPPGLRSLDASFASGILPTLADNAGSRGMGSPSRIIRQGARTKGTNQGKTRLADSPPPAAAGPIRAAAAGDGTHAAAADHRAADR
jgi:hypothetical protein